MSSRKLYYLDHAATSYPKPPSVVSATVACMRHSGGNPGRGSHSQSLAAAKEIYACREAAASFFHTEPDRVIFTLNATHALNVAIKGVMGRGGHAVCSDMEHNSVYRPLWKLKERGVADFDVFDTFPTASVRSDSMILSSLTSKLKASTRAVICSHVSNLCSAALPIARIGAFCRRNGLVFIVDAAQSAGHIPIDVERMQIDLLCVPGHKGLLGPQGTGMLIMGRRMALDTLMEGGNGMDSLRADMSEDLPERHEVGTLQTPAIAGLRAGLEVVRTVGVEEIAAHEAGLYRMLREELSGMPKIKLYAPMHEGSTLLFSVEGHASEEVGRYLDAKGICVRAGFHCSALGHKTLKTPSDGAVRASLGWYSERRDAEALVKALKEL